MFLYWIYLELEFLSRPCNTAGLQRWQLICLKQLLFYRHAMKSVFVVLVRLTWHFWRDIFFSINVCILELRFFFRRIRIKPQLSKSESWSDLVIKLSYIWSGCFIFSPIHDSLCLNICMKKKQGQTVHMLQIATFWYILARVYSGWPRSYCKYILRITQPSQYGYAKLQYRFAVTSGSPSSLSAKATWLLIL